MYELPFLTRSHCCRFERRGPHIDCLEDDEMSTLIVWMGTAKEAVYTKSELGVQKSAEYNGASAFCERVESDLVVCGLRVRFARLFREFVRVRLTILGETPFSFITVFGVTYVNAPAVKADCVDGTARLDE